MHISEMTLRLQSRFMNHFLRKGESADVYYNLGNSYYKINEIAKAILNYEKGLVASAR